MVRRPGISHRRHPDARAGPAPVPVVRWAACHSAFPAERHAD